MQRIPATDPDTLFTPNQLVARLRVLSGGKRSIGIKRIRTDIRSCRLRASRGGSWNWIRWGDFLDYLESMQVKAEPTVERRVEQRVKARLRRENDLGGPARRM